MNIIITDDWLREYLQTNAGPKDIGRCLSLCGPSVEKVFKINGYWAYDIEITTNRIDTASVMGIAREATAILPEFGYQAFFKSSLIKFKPITETNKLKISIQDPDKVCQRVLGVIMDNVKLAASPQNFVRRLETAGIRSLNNAVDVTNYVMTEIGHPAHIFDYDRLTTKKLVLRKAKPGEKIISLENKKYFLSGGDIIIDDGTGNIIDLPGIIGTANSVVTNSTKRVLFFIETNNAVAIRKSSMSLGIRTVAATYNEKGVDPELGMTALLRGIDLLTKLTGAKTASKIYDLYPKPYQKKSIIVKTDHINKYLGISLALSKITSILKSLGFNVSAVQVKQQITADVPSWRAKDINIPEDLIEEISRIYGYHKLPGILPNGELPQRSAKQIFSFENLVKHTLTDWGFTETYTYSMQSKIQLENCQRSPKNYLTIANPLTEEWIYMRQSLIPSLLTVISQNQGYKKKVKIFELAHIYLPKIRQIPEEKPILALIITNNSEDIFYILKGNLETLLNKIGLTNLTFNKFKDLDSYPEFKPTKTTLIRHKDKNIGVLGQIKEEVSNSFDIPTKIFAAVLDFNTIVSLCSSIKNFEPLPVYPPIIEDITFTLANKVYYADLIQLIKQINPLIAKIEFMDLYKNNLTLRITYQNSKQNLSTKEVEVVRNKIINQVKAKGWATVRELV